MANQPVRPPFPVYVAMLMQAARAEGLLPPAARWDHMDVYHLPGCSFPLDGFCSCQPMVWLVYKPEVRRG